MATIYDVARLAGVSPKTVSRVLNADGPVGEKTREAVEKAMRELGYVRSNAARMMRAQKSGIIGLITGAISTRNQPSIQQGLPDLFIVQGIQRALESSGTTLMIADTAGRNERVPHLIDTFLSHRVEGLIYVAEYHQEVSLPALPDDTPLVLANCFDSRGTPAVLPDDRRLQADLVRRLIAAGHRRIAFLALRPDMVAGRLRPFGYRDALAEAGLPFDPLLLAHVDFDQAEIGPQVLWDTIDRMLRLDSPPTVLCCGNDQMAMMVYGILRSMGRKVPDEIGVAGFDNYRVIAETLYPPLTTVELPYTAIGARTGERLLQLIAGESREAGPTLVAGPVYWRASVNERRPENVLAFRNLREENE
ncbi:LacI family DNA-binding transcriptional regulator [Tabrizicola oligotrophica]|uniref:LacI family DNA-binding transcriptional regulator n=1 Tax=Tabrizicola oligotrophica TaxID=2710650 RepID=A0A6M0QPA8_9RHOB|nr:LacI family DNA-binding transcriptional regulator [Tabrizicola oligotrophica]NEY89310.1 LacI family DNA-binding transcriptional regulator [Tabrizicola oligotrophica]